MTVDTVVSSAERILADHAKLLLGIREGECMLCYVHRMLVAHDCAGLRFAKRYRDLRAPRATALEKRLAQKGGFCDCEIFLNAYTIRPRFLVPVDAEADELTWPDPLPSCYTVRRGSTQPCVLWCRRMGGMWW